MLLSPSANRFKSWTCEHCDNWTTQDKNICQKCFWAYPEKYEHIAGKQQRIIWLVFSDSEILDYERLLSQHDLNEAKTIIKSLIFDYLKNYP
jgi:hypothetical protein